MRKNLALILFLTLIALLFFNCNRKKSIKNSYYYLNFKDCLTIKVIKKSIDGKGMFLNDSVVLYKTSKLIYENQNPKWLFEKTKNKEFLENEYIYSPEVSEIEAPYKLIKQKNSNIFQIIKNSDTIYFDFEDFEELDF